MRSQGIDAILDQYEESPPEGWPRWMDRQVHNADFVIMVCTPIYFKRVMGLEEHGKGLGGIWESGLIYQRLYNNAGINNKFIPVLFSDSGSYEDIPTPLQSATHYIADSDNGFDKLYWRLRGVPNAAVKPELGELRPLEEKERKTMFITSLIDIELWDKANWRACAYLFTEDSSVRPGFALIFEEKEYALEIIKQFKNTLADNDFRDKYEELRIAIIDADLNNSNGYFVTISTNVDGLMKRYEDMGVTVDLPNSLILSISRNHYMAHVNTDFKTRFFKDYRKFGEYDLLIGYVENERVRMVEDFALVKKSIEKRHIKEVKDDDIDATILPLYHKILND